MSLVEILAANHMVINVCPIFVLLTDYQHRYCKVDRIVMNMLFRDIEKGITLSPSEQASKAWQALYTVAVLTRSDAHHRATGHDPLFWVVID